ncbi:hypothetical protein UFOVP777_9 [uncultured Caudovirales phage]|uniref:Uncharacterized protein n=1 Tax=uncultured Caudovirales phage TaxID=2100421 RepID=A0A6J5NX83_9CAUD|nr:hypothetical protein UFOVP777_9 [uncultured Caudovirales phage]
MAYIHEIAQLFRGYADDPDQTFFSDADVAVALKLGYQEFRNIVFKAAPEVYETTYSANVAGTSLALAGILFGANPTKTRCLRITRVEMVSDLTANAAFQGLMDPASSRENLYSGWAQTRWLIQGTNLIFSASVARAIRINYLPDDTLNWAAGIVSGSNVYVDDLTNFHDLVALLAYQQYAIRDFTDNPALVQQLRKRLADFAGFLSMGRTGDADRWVQSEDDGW